MFNSFRRRARTVAALGIAAALAVGGVALAQGGSGSGNKSNQHRALKGKRMPPPPGGPMGKDLTYAQFHVQRDGEAEVIRLDRGEVVSADSSSITVSENDGNEVTVPVDDSTKVLAGPNRDTDVSDLQAGQEVLVSGPEGGTAKAVIVPPRRGSMHRGPKGSGRQGPPPGGQFGGPQGAPPSGNSN